MKKYKVVRTKISFEEIGTGNYDSLENLMNDMAKDGWELVCQSPQPGASANFMLLTFCREEV